MSIYERTKAYLAELNAYPRRKWYSEAFYQFVAGLIKKRGL